MPAKKDKEKEMDPEKLMRRKFRAKCHFRALIRLVLFNLYWLSEDVEVYEGLDDVQRRVQQAVRGKKKKPLLRICDKALLNKPTKDRTDQEKLYLYKIIGGLKCFKRYPNHVKRRLAGVTYFKYYGPGRTVVRQNQEAHALYFIVSGNVVVSQKVFDELLQKHISVDVGEMFAGDMFGEISLLHNIPRTATVTTTTHCEFLALVKEDFKYVLQTSIQKQWDEVRTAMSYFSYFNALDEVSKREGCIVAKLKSFKPNETVLGDGFGIANHVYFILRGTCQMIEQFHVHVTTHLGKEFFTLYDPYVSKEESEESMNTKYFKAYEQKLQELGMIGTTEISASAFDRPSMGERSASKRVKSSGVGFLQAEDSSRPPTMSVTSELESILSARDPSCIEPSSKLSLRLTEKPIEGRKRVETRTYFMQVCQFKPGGSFGFGENMRDRRIVALTPMDCMLMPKVWLLHRNHANIWTRIEHYLVKKIPTKMKLFKEFVSQQKWQRYKNDLVTEVLARTNTPNWTTVHDVPYSIRMEECQDVVFAKDD